MVSTAALHVCCLCLSRDVADGVMMVLCHSAAREQQRQTVEIHGRVSLPLVTLCRACCEATEKVHQAGLVELPKPEGLSGRHRYSLAF